MSDQIFSNQMEQNSSEPNHNNPITKPEVTLPVSEPISTSFAMSIPLTIVKSLSGWGLFRAVIDIIAGSFYCLGGIMFVLISVLIFVAGSAGSGALDLYGDFAGAPSGMINMMAGIYLACGVAYPIIGVFMILYSVKLIKAVDKLKQAIALKNDSALLEYFHKLSNFFKFNGIYTLVRIGLVVILMILAIVLIVFAISSAGGLQNDLNSTGDWFQ